MRTIKESCLNHLVLFGEASLRKAAREFIGHYHSELNHQGLDNRPIAPEVYPLMSDEAVQRRKRLGGLLNYYYRAACPFHSLRPQTDIRVFAHYWKRFQKQNRSSTQDQGQ